MAMPRATCAPPSLDGSGVLRGARCRAAGRALGARWRWGASDAGASLGAPTHPRLADTRSLRVLQGSGGRGV